MERKAYHIRYKLRLRMLDLGKWLQRVQRGSRKNIAVSKVQRFGELLRRIDGITQSTLTKQLRELEDDGFIHREIYKEVPPKVEYTLTDLGKSFVPILTQMMMWSQTHLCAPDYVSPYTEEQIKELLGQ